MLDRREKQRYPLLLRGSYLSPVWIADGRVVNMSSSGLLFRTVDAPPEKPAGLVRLDLDWPARLYGTIAIRCRVQGRVVRSQGCEIAVLILSHEFHLRGCPLGEVTYGRLHV